MQVCSYTDKMKHEIYFNIKFDLSKILYHKNIYVEIKLTKKSLIAVYTLSGTQLFVDYNCLFHFTVFAPSVTDLAVGVETSSTLEIRWSLPYPIVPPTIYNISYTFAQLYGTNPDQGSVLVSINHADVTENVGMSAVVYNYTLSNLLAFSEYNVSLVAVYEGGLGSQPVSLDGLKTLQGGLSLVVIFTPKVAKNFVSNHSNVFAMNAFGCYICTCSQLNISVPAIIIINLYSF